MKYRKRTLVGSQRVASIATVCANSSQARTKGSRGRARLSRERVSRGIVAIAIAVAIATVVRRAGAIDCSASRYAVSAQTRVAALLEAGGLAANGHWPDARAAYLWVLARYPGDPEATAGLARVDAWGGCWAIAEKEYAAVLAAHPEDADVRAGYVDLLVWRHRNDDAERALAAGLALDAAAPPLLARAARFASWRGDAAEAVRLADAAEKGSPDDDEIRAERDHLFLGEGRLTAHMDGYLPASRFQSVYSVAAQVLQRIQRFELYAGAQLVDREGGPPGAVPIHDVRYPIGASYHPGTGWTLGLEVAPAAPAKAVPAPSVRGWVIMPIFGPFDGSFSYDFWHFTSDGQTEVHLLNPAIGVSLPYELRLELRAWIAVVTVLQPGSPRRRVEPAGAGGAQLTWSATSRIDLSLSAAYGRELDASLIATDVNVISFQGPSAMLTADVLLNRHFGVRPSAGAQYLAQDSQNGAPSPSPFWILSFELGAYARW
jgi:tetratricopeptide (TPR) repeat protein